MNLPPQAPPVGRDAKPDVTQLLGAAQDAIRAARTACLVAQELLEAVGTKVILERGDFGKDAHE